MPPDPVPAPSERVWDTAAHRERYRKVLMREMTLEQALAEAADEHRHAQTELDAAFLLMRGHRPAGRERWVRVDERGDAL